MAAEDSWWSMLRYTSPVNVAPPLTTFGPCGEGEMIFDSGMMNFEACVMKMEVVSKLYQEEPLMLCSNHVSTYFRPKAQAGLRPTKASKDV